MINIICLVFFCFLIANQMAVLSVNYPSVWIASRKRFSVGFLYIILLASCTLFSGLRTTYNDTYMYIHSFNVLDIRSIDLYTLLEPYGGFDILQMLIKQYMSNDPQVFLLVTAFIVNSIFIWFYAKHAKHFGWTILAYFILGPYVFSMAGMKQILSMAVSLIALDNLLNRKYIKFFSWILLASTFHPYIICLLAIPILDNRLWSKRVILLLAICIFFVINLEVLLDLASIIGKDYTIEEMTSNTINPIRVIIEWIPVFISIIYVKMLQHQNNKLLNMGVNMLILGAFFTFLGLFVNPIYFGRVATYFSVINAITVPMMLCIILKGTGSVVLKLTTYFGFYFLYFLLDLMKLGSISFFTDLFNHTWFF